MSIRKKIFIAVSLVIFCTVGILLLILQYVLKRQFLRYAESSSISVTVLNKKLLAGFLSNNDAIVLRLTASKQIGTIADMDHYAASEVQHLKAALLEELSNAIGFQMNNIQYQTETILFFNADMPIGSLFVAEDLNAVTGGTYRMYSDELIKNTDWYRTLQHRQEPYYIFTLPEHDKLYFAYTVQNTYSHSTYRKEGLGTLIIAVPIRQMYDLVYFYPLTEHSSFAVLNSSNEILFSDFKHDHILTGTMSIDHINRISVPDSGITVKLDNDKLLCTVQGLPKGLKLVYLTPMQDINRVVNSAAIPVLLIIAAGSLILLALLLLSTRYITQPIIKLSRDIASITDTRTVDPALFSGYIDSEVKILCASFKQLLETSNMLIKNAETQTALRKDMELRALQAQINPHFIFNAMDTVNWMALSEGKSEIADLVDAIAEVMRYSISEAEQPVPLATEILNIKKLIYIYECRFPGKIVFEVHASSALCSHLYIPKFIVQPLVENSIKYGKDLHKTDLYVRLEGEERNGCTVLRVIDDGAGCDTDSLNRYLHYENVDFPVHGGFGVRNVNERIRLFFGQDSALHFYYNEEQCFTAEMILNLRETSQN